MKWSLKAASLVEALVASVIFLTVFMIAMSSLTNIARINCIGPAPVDVEDAVKECMEKFAEQPAPSASYEYEWGAVAIQAEQYKGVGGLLDVTVTARAHNNRYTVIYRYLICPRSI